MNKLIIFDCDGVLVDSESIANKVEADVLTSLGYPISAEVSIERFTGMNTTTVKQHILEETGLVLPINFRELTTEKILEAFERDLNPLMTSLLSNDVVRKTAKCVASNSPTDRILYSLERTDLLQYFDPKNIFSFQNVKKGKPAPDLFLHAANQMGFASEHCLVIEDSVIGIQAAKAARMKVVAFLGGSHAQAPWYKARIIEQNVPIAYDLIDLLSIVLNFIKDPS